MVEYCLDVGIAGSSGNSTHVVIVTCHANVSAVAPRCTPAVEGEKEGGRGGEGRGETFNLNTIWIHLFTSISLTCF